MDALSSVEGELLNQRSNLVAQESAMADPIWVRDSAGTCRIESVAMFRPQIESVVFLAQTLDLDDGALQQLPFVARFATSILSEDLIASAATEKILQALRTQSAAERRNARF